MSWVLVLQDLGCLNITIIWSLNIFMKILNSNQRRGNSQRAEEKQPSVILTEINRDWITSVYRFFFLARLYVFNLLDQLVDFFNFFFIFACLERTAHEPKGKGDVLKTVAQHKMFRHWIGMTSSYFAWVDWL